MNRYQRCASNYAYYGYLNNYYPSSLRKYQALTHYQLGRKGAYDTLVYKMAADHVNYEQQFNQRYKLPTAITNFSMRLGWFWFIVPAISLSFFLGDMTRLFIYFPLNTTAKMKKSCISPTRYESMYIMSKNAKI